MNVIPNDTDQRRTALITGITGQDGSYLAEFLLEQGYEVHGLARPNASLEGINSVHIRGVRDQLVLHKGDITDPYCVLQVLRDVQPDEIYHLAAQSHVSQSFETPSYTMRVNVTGTLNILQSIVSCHLQMKTRLYNAATSELFGGTLDPAAKLNEQSPFDPKSPYGISKQAAMCLVKNYRDSYGLWAVNGILFNHESARRGKSFVTQRIARGVASHAYARTAHRGLTLAGVDMTRDWGHAKDYVRGMWMMMQQELPYDMVLATGESHTVREFVECAFAHVGILLRWLLGPEGEIVGAEDDRTGETIVNIDPGLKRPVDIKYLVGDSSVARARTGWAPTTRFESLVGEMVDAEISRLKSLSS